MKSKIPIVLTCLMILVMASVKIVSAQGQSPANAVPVGQSIKTRVECGAKAGSMEPYDATISVLQVVRGKEAWDLIKASSANNQPPPTGFEYLLARIAFEMKAFLKPGDKTFELARMKQFVVLTVDGNEQDPPSVIPPEPELHRVVRADEPAEGWIALLVEQKNAKPIMFFDPAAGGAMGGGKILFFQLY
jgi:hypothetical protein